MIEIAIQLPSKLGKAPRFPDTKTKCVPEDSIDTENYNLASELLGFVLNARRDAGRRIVQERVSDGFVHMVKHRDEPLPGVCSGGVEWRGDARQGQVGSDSFVLLDRVAKWGGLGREPPCLDFPDYPALLEMLERDRCWSLERAFIRLRTDSYNHDIEEDAKNSEGDNNVCDGSVDGPHIPRQAASGRGRAN